MEHIEQATPADVPQLADVLTKAIRFYQRHGFQPSEMTPLRLHL